jgi:dipeptidyl aminopeptidase/acylaminoacyl peptidase
MGGPSPAVMDPRSGEREDLPLPGIEGGVVPCDWSLDGRELLLCHTRDAVQTLLVLDLGTRQVRRLDHPSGTYGLYGRLGLWFGAGEEIVAQWEDSVEPRQVIALDRQTGRRTRTLLAPTPVPPGRPWSSVTFVTDDGQRLQAWLATPEGEGPFPAVIETHGGPESVTTDAYLPRAQLWLDHGFAYLSVNYRGSITFGRAFKESIWGRVGELEVRDVVAGRRYLVEQGVAIPELIFLTGWSYGGYITLQAMGVAPGLWAGGMAGVAVADWVSQYEDENETLRAYDRALFGGAPSDQPDAYAEASPIAYADRVDAPVLVVQGRNDSRCPARQVERYEARLRALGKPIEVIWFEAGHLGGDIELSIGHAAAMLAFTQRIVTERGAATR